MLTDEMAAQFALMLQAGLPVDHCMIYLLPEATTAERESYAAGWVRSKALAKAVKRLQNDKEWHQLSLEDRIQRAIDKHYSELAYFLYTHNYSQVEGIGKTKADTARSVLETKLAGLAGKNDPLTRFYEDLKKGTISLDPAKANQGLPLPKIGQA